MITINLNLTPPITESTVRDAIDVSDFGLSMVDKEYTTSLGRIDILAKDGNDDLIPIEVKLGEATDGAVGQILGYMKSIGASRGILIAAEFSKRVRAISKDLDIDLIPYTLDGSVALCAGRHVALHVPLWIRSYVESVRATHLQSENSVYIDLINVGIPIFETKYMDLVKETNELYLNMIQHANNVISEELLDKDISLDIGCNHDREKVVRLNLPGWCEPALTAFCTPNLMSESAMVNIVISLALESMLSFGDYYEHSKQHIAAFDETFRFRVNVWDAWNSRLVKDYAQRWNIIT